MDAQRFLSIPKRSGTRDTVRPEPTYPMSPASTGPCRWWTVLVLQLGGIQAFLPRTMEHPQLQGTHRDHQSQLLIPSVTCHTFPNYSKVSFSSLKELLLMIWQWARKMTKWKDASLSMQQLLAVLWNICSTLVPGCKEAQWEHDPLLFIWTWLDMKSSGQTKHQLHKSTVPLITGTEHLPCSTYQ